MKFAFYYIENLLEFVYAYIIGCAFLSVNYRSNIIYRCFASIPLIFLFTLFSDKAPNEFCITIINVLYTVILYVYVFRICMADAILLSAFMFALVMAFEGVLQIFITLSGIAVDYVVFAAISNLVLVFLAFLLYKYIRLDIVFNYVMSANLYIKSLVIDIFIAFFAYMLLARTNFDRQADYTILFILASYMISINVETIYYQKKNDRQAKELENYEKYLPIVEEMVGYIRLQQHDFNNHLQAIQMLPLTHTDYNSLKQAVMTYGGGAGLIPANLEVLKLNMKLVAGFLVSKSEECMLRKRNIKIEIRNYSLQTIVPEYKLIEIMGILVDNAIEASSEEQDICVQIDSIENQVYFYISNPGPELTPQLRNLFFTKGYSTKQYEKRQHGLGLYKLKKIADSYNGMIILDNKIIDGQMLVCFEIRI
ncbi:MAG: GHKL domain-containing protein [Lachnospiraceae bacterium]|nr:GHKL domain-containing protein [Lachnospiraceae bacterium]